MNICRRVNKRVMVVFTQVWSLAAEIGLADLACTIGSLVPSLQPLHQLLHIIIYKYNDMDHVITRLHIVDLSVFAQSRMNHLLL